MSEETTEVTEAAPTSDVMTSYDIEQYLKVDDVAELATEMMGRQVLAAEMRILLKSFQILPAAKYKPDGKGKGKPSNLYSRDDIFKFMICWSEYVAG